MLTNESAGNSTHGCTGGLSQGVGGRTARNGLFKQRDMNTDDKLSRDELPAALFGRPDTNNNSVVTEDELKALRGQN